MSTPGQPFVPDDRPIHTGAASGSADPYAGAPTGYLSHPAGRDLPAEPVRPRPVDLAFWCWILTTAISLVGLILTLTSPVWDDAVAAGVRSSGQQVDVQTLVTVTKTILIVIFLIFAAVYLLFAFKMRAGRNWARITLTVFGALTLLSVVTAGSTSSVTVGSETYSAGSRGPSWLTAVVALVGIVLMFVGESNRFFAASKAHRQRRYG
jgi:hypothetical protein